MKYRIATIVIMMTALLYPNLVCGQGSMDNATLKGRVLDPSGAVMPNVTLELLDVNKGTKWTGVSNSEGYYTINAIPFGSYRLTAKSTGFADTIVTPLNLTAKQVAEVDLTMKPGSTIQTVQVTTAALQIENQTSDLGGDLVNKIVTELPTAHRNPIELVGLVPGVTNVRTEGGNTMNTNAATGTWGMSNYDVGGFAGSSSGYTLDGVDASDSYSPGQDGATVVIPPESIQEFRLHTFDTPADMPRGNGVLSFITKSGTNTLHGLMMFNLQNSYLNAADWIGNSLNKPKPLLIRNEPGGTIGGPVYIPKLYDGRNKTFFFFDYDEIKQPLATVFQTRVPTASELVGNFNGEYSTDGNEVAIYNPFDTYTDPATGRTFRRPFANNQIPVGMINQFAKNVAGYYPAANVPGGVLTASGLPTQANNFYTRAPAPFELRDWNLRFDEQLTSSNRFMYRYVSYPRPTTCQNVYGNVASPTNCESPLAYMESGTWNWTISPNLIMTVTANYNNHPFTIHNFNSPTNQFDLTTLGGPYSDAAYYNLLKTHYQYLSFPSIGIGGYGALGASAAYGYPGAGGGEWALNFTKGKHSFKTGFQFYTRAELAAQTITESGGYQSTGFGFSGNFTNGPDPLNPSVDTGNSLADMELGLLGSGQINLPSTERLERSTYYAWYLMDDMRVTPKLTLNLGIRYDFELPTREAHGNIASFNDTLANPLGNDIGPNTGGQTLNQALGRTLMGAYEYAFSPQANGSARPYFVDYHDLSPRFGFAYSLNRKTVLRGGIAKIFSPSPSGTTDNGLCPTCTGSTTLVSTINGVNPNPAVSLTDPFPNGFNFATGSSRGLLGGVGNGFTETGTTFDVSPYAYEFSFGVQRELPSNSLLSVSYVGNRVKRLPCPQQACNDQLNISTVQQYGTALNNTVPNPFYGIITNPSSTLSAPTIQQWRLLMTWPQFPGGTLNFPSPQNQRGFSIFPTQYPLASDWNALLLSYEKRFSNGLELMVSFTGSKLLTNADGLCCTYSWNGYQDLYHINKNMGIGEEDIPRRLVFTHVYQLPVGKGKRFQSNASKGLNEVIGGWQLGGYFTYSSGNPLFYKVTPNNSNTHSSTLYPDIVHTPTLINGSRATRVNEWFDTTAFAAPAPYTLGDAPRNIASTRTDSLKNYDASLSKFFPLYKESWKAELRLDSFNVFNRPTFAAPNTTLGSLSFGHVTSTAQSPRFLQIGLRIMF